MRVLELNLGANRRDIDGRELENLFARHKSQRIVAKHLKMDASYLSRKINESVELMQARTRGLKRAA